MAYDEHYAGSEAGSVASLPFVREAVSDTIDMVPSKQVISRYSFLHKNMEHIRTDNNKPRSRYAGCD